MLLCILIFKEKWWEKVLQPYIVRIDNIQWCNPIVRIDSTDSTEQNRSSESMSRPYAEDNSHLNSQSSFDDEDYHIRTVTQGLSQRVRDAGNSESSGIDADGTVGDPAAISKDSHESTLPLPKPILGPFCCDQRAKPDGDLTFCCPFCVVLNYEGLQFTRPNLIILFLLAIDIFLWLTLDTVQKSQHFWMLMLPAFSSLMAQVGATHAYNFKRTTYTPDII